MSARPFASSLRVSMPTVESDQTKPPLEWARKDIEQRLFFRGGRHTRVNNALGATLGLVASVVVCAVFIFAFKDATPTLMLTRESSFPIPYVIVFLTAWSGAILFLKHRKLSLQRQALRHDVTPNDPSFILSSANVDHVVTRMYRICDDPRQFVLYSRILVALANLKNLGQIGDVDEILRSQADNDEAASETSYSVLGGFVWAIPVLGFIGTVMGLSGAMLEFTGVLSAGTDMEEIKTKLGDVVNNLGTAFETTLMALVAALLIQIAATFVKKSEQEFLDECSRYCIGRVVNKLRIMPYEADEQPLRRRVETAS